MPEESSSPPPPIRRSPVRTKQRRKQRRQRPRQSPQRPPRVSPTRVGGANRLSGNHPQASSPPPPPPMTNNNNNKTWRNRMGLQVPMEEQAEQLARRLQQASEILLEKLFAYLSQLPEEELDDDEEDPTDDTPSRRRTTTTNNNNNTTCSGMTLPAAAVGWLSCQLFPMTTDILEDDEDEDLNHVHEDAAHTTSLWMGVTMRDRLSLLRFLLPRVTHLRLTRQAWPPELPKPTRKTKKMTLRRRRQAQAQPSSSSQRPPSEEPPEELNCSTMSVSSALTTDWDLNHIEPPTRQAFLEYMQTLQNHPRLDMRVFPKVQVLVLEGIPPTWIYNTYSLQPSLQVLRISKACLYHVPSLLFPKPVRRRTPQQQNVVVAVEGEDPLAAPPSPPPRVVNNYPKLSHFKLDHCGVGELSRLPQSLSKLRHLQSLSLAHNDICTEATALKGLKQLSLLKTLDLSYNRLSSLPLANHYLGQLKVLKLSHNQLVTTRGGLDKLYSLEELWLDGNQISEVSMISGVCRLPQLQVLHLAGNPMHQNNYRKQVLSWCQQERRGLSPKELPILDGMPVTVKEWIFLQGESGVFVSAVVVGVVVEPPTTSNSSRRGADTTASTVHNEASITASTTTTIAIPTTPILSHASTTGTITNESSSMVLLSPSRNRRVTRKGKPHKAKISSNWQLQTTSHDTAVVDETLPKTEEQDPIDDDDASSNSKRAVFEATPKTEQGQVDDASSSATPPAAAAVGTLQKEQGQVDDSFAKPIGSNSRLLPQKKRTYKYENQQQQQQQQLPSISFSVEDVLRSLQTPLRRQEPEDDLSPTPKLISEDDHPTSSSTTTTETSPTAASSADSETCRPATTSKPMMATLKGTRIRDGPEVDDLPDAPTTLPIDHDTQKDQSSTPPLPPSPEMATVPPKEQKAPSTKSDLSPVVDTRMASSKPDGHPEETTESISASKGHQSAHNTTIVDAESIMNASVATNGSKKTDPKEARSPTDVDANRSMASDGSKKKMSDLKSSPKRKEDDAKPIIMQPKPKVATIKLHTGATQQFDIFSADWDELVRQAAEGLIPNGKIRTPVAELEQQQQSKKQGGVFSMDAVDLLAPATTEFTTRQQLDTSTVATVPNNDQMSQTSEIGSGFRSMSMPEHIWSDDFSVPSSLGTNRDDFPKLNKFQLAEDNAVYDGPDACRDMNVMKNLELYFNTFVFPSSIPDLPLLSDNEEEAMNEDENWEMVVKQYPRIQLWPEDRRWLENSLSPMSQQIVDWASTNSRERFVRVWEEDVVPCGKPSLRRLAPNRRSRLGFHGDQLFKNTGPEPYAECRRVILCLSSSAFYIILREDSVTSKYQQQGKKKRFAVPVSDEALFGDAPWPHSVVRHSFQELQAITIGFEFQRLALRFSNPAIRKTDPFVYMLLTSNKKETVGVLQEIQRLAKEANEHVTDLVSDSTAVAIENDSQAVFDALAVTVAPDLVGTILHYQIVQQRWKSGGEQRGTVRRVCIVTDTKIFLLDEDYAADGHKALENNRSGKLDNVSYRIVDEATLKQVAEVQAAGADPTAITIIINPLSRLSRTHRWRLLCRDSSGAERLVEDVRKALGQIEE